MCTKSSFLVAKQNLCDEGKNLGKKQLVTGFISETTFCGGPGETMNAFVYNFFEVMANQSPSPPLEVSMY
jgi:hypothetical protein